MASRGNVCRITYLNEENFLIESNLVLSALFSHIPNRSWAHMNIENEIWKQIKGYEGYYSVSNFGNVRNDKTNQLLTGDINTAGYRRVILYQPIKKRYFIHRLVAYHFVEGFNDKLVVNHKNGLKTDNRADNLEWVTRSENDLHAYKNDLRHVHNSGHKGDMYYQVFDYATGALIKEYARQSDLQNDYQMCRVTVVTSCKRGWFYGDWKHKSHKIGIRRIFK